MSTSFLPDQQNRPSHVLPTPSRFSLLQLEKCEKYHFQAFQSKALSGVSTQMASEYTGTQKEDGTEVPFTLGMPILTGTKVDHPYESFYYQWSPYSDGSGSVVGNQLYYQRQYEHPYQNPYQNPYPHPPSSYKLQCVNLSKAANPPPQIQSLRRPPRTEHLCWEHGCNGRRFSTRSNLLRHQRERKGETEKPLCPRCGMEFTRPTAMNKHRQTTCQAKN